MTFRILNSNNKLDSNLVVGISHAIKGDSYT